MRIFKLITCFVVGTIFLTNCTILQEAVHSNNQKVSENVKLVTNVEFAKVNGEPLLCDVLRAKNSKGISPVVIYIHGGGWTGGSKYDQRGINSRLAEKGFTVISINYRLAGNGKPKFPVQLHDVNAAIRWVKANAKTLKIDKNKIALMGNSAGAHLAMMAALAGDKPGLKGNVGNHLSQNSKVQAVVNIHGPVDFFTMTRDKDCGECLIDYETNKQSPPYALLGCFISECPDKYRQANPLDYVTADAPPFLNINGDRDKIVPYQQAKRMDDALKNLGVSSKLIIAQGNTHSGSLNAIYLEDIVRFLRANL